MEQFFAWNNGYYKDNFGLQCFGMNKIGNQRYASYGQIPPKKSTHEQAKHSQPRAASLLVRKQGQIDVVKRRISALCVQEQRYNNKAANSEIEYERKEAVQKESQRIQRLLEQQRKKEADKLDIVRFRNLQTRADNYFKTRLAKDQKYRQIRDNSQTMRRRSREYHSTISENKMQDIEANYSKSRSIYDQTKYAQEERNRFLMKKRESAIEVEKRQNQHLRKLEEIKEYQLGELGRLQLIMVEKSNTSRATYEAKRERLSSRSSKSRYQTNPIISKRVRKPSAHSMSMQAY